MNGPVHAHHRKPIPPLHDIPEFANPPDRRRRGEIFLEPATRMRFEKTRHRCGGCRQPIWYNAEKGTTLCRTEECPLHKPVAKTGTDVPSGS